MDKLIIFTRYPVPGITKTRLIKDIGPENGADVHRKLTENIFNQIRKLQAGKGFSCEVCYTGGMKKEMEAWLGNDLTYTEQVQGDLGVKMYSSITGALDAGSRKVVLIGTDIPAPITGYIEQAFCELDKTDICLGPVTDGGYWLVGMKRASDIFNGVRWGTETVLSQTLELIKHQGLSFYLLPEINDIDTVDDLVRCGQHEVIKQHLPVWLSYKDSIHE
jgi:rSAM/selenodomain-associated transferase 1